MVCVRLSLMVSHAARHCQVFWFLCWVPAPLVVAFRLWSDEKRNSGWGNCGSSASLVDFRRLMGFLVDTLTVQSVLISYCVLNGYIGRLWPYSLFLCSEVKKIGSQVTKCAWSPTPVTQKWCVPFVVACDPIRARIIIFEGSLAEKLRFLSFEASFFKEVSQKSFVLELRSFIFEGSLAEKLGFWVSKLHFWRKSRRKASF